MQHVQVSELKEGANVERLSLPLAKAHGIVVRRKQESHLGPSSQADQDNVSFAKAETFDITYKRLQGLRVVILVEAIGIRANASPSYIFKQRCMATGSPKATAFREHHDPHLRRSWGSPE